MLDVGIRAQTLVEALPYIKKFRGKTVVVKYGGSIGTEDLLNFTQDVVLMKYVGIKPVVVHGGGMQIQEHLDGLGIRSDFVAGLRVTDEKIMRVVEMVLVGKITQQIVSSINEHGIDAVGLSGKETRLIRARKLDVGKFASEHQVDIPRNSDLGYVGEVVKITPDIIRVLETHDVIPVIAPIGTGSDGTTYNINADHAAGMVAGALGAAKLIFLTDVKGILDDEGELISSITKKEIDDLVRNETISSGMIPKVACAVKALQEGVGKVHIINGKMKRALILELLTDSGIGTEITL